MNAHIDVHEQKPPQPVDSPLAFSMEGQTDFSGSLITSYWAPGWNSGQALNKFQFEVGGALRGGNPGHLLITPNGAEHKYSKAPNAFKSGKDSWLLVPRHHIFGSDELSLHSASLVERVPKPCVTINADDAESLGIATDDEVELAVAGGSLCLPAKLSTELPPGVAVVPVGLPGLGFLDLSAPAGIARVAP
jgi:NADH-quinone oxidoreductase subunit G